jgi:hypothetical protein
LIIKYKPAYTLTHKFDLIGSDLRLAKHTFTIAEENEQDQINGAIPGYSGFCGWPGWITRMNKGYCRSKCTTCPVLQSGKPDVAKYNKSHAVF